jgi:hypothetical protein
MVSKLISPFKSYFIDFVFHFCFLFKFELSSVPGGFCLSLHRHRPKKVDVFASNVDFREKDLKLNEHDHFHMYFIIKKVKKNSLILILHLGLPLAQLFYIATGIRT